MRILAVDVGTGTQDVLLFDSERQLENCYRLVMPSPTVVVANRVRAATAAREPVVLRGVMMGGGPCAWAVNDHLEAGLAVYATPAAAQTFDDDLERVSASGVCLVSDDEARAIADAVRIEMRDFWLDEILAALATFGVTDRPEALAVAVFDHGAAPPGFSDRTFRFNYLAERVQARNSLTAFAYPGDAIPSDLTRLAAVASSAPGDLSLVVMDTAPAAVLGALEDARVQREMRLIVANVGNFHCLAFRLEGGRIAGLFEHHSGELTREKLRRYVEKLAAGTITNQEVFDDMGHGALTFEAPAEDGMPFLAVTGPRRALLAEDGLAVYLAVPHGDMMQTGCFGLLRAYAALEPSAADEVARRLGPPRTRASA
jgi:uncharacterized protein (DUF1786 family)